MPNVGTGPLLCVGLLLGPHPEKLDASGRVLGETQAAFLAYEAGGLPFACKTSWVRNDSGWKESLLSALAVEGGQGSTFWGTQFWGAISKYECKSLNLILKQFLEDMERLL